jgi:uncharacterized protein
MPFLVPIKVRPPVASLPAFKEYKAKKSPFSLVLVSLGALLVVAAPAQSQTCPTVVDSVNPRSIDAQWPNAYYNKFPMMPTRISGQQSRACVQTPPGFSAHLWASENALFGGIRAPIAIAFDERGRVWAVESFDYPHNTLSNAFAGGDRIVILEDRNGDGLADSLKVFVQGLNLASSLVHTKDGLLVAASNRLILFKDLNGDDVADVDTGQTLYTGLQRNVDTHGAASNLMYGLDNWIYGIMGYNTSTVNGVSVRGGIFRVRTDTSVIQMMTPTSGENTWGLGMSETGQFFYSRANRDHSRHMAYPGNVASAIVRIPNYACAAAPSEVPPVPSGQIYSCPKPVTTHWHINNPGYSSASNHSLYTARQFPEKYWDRAAFVCESPRHLCHTMYLRQNGSTWTGFEDSSAAPSAYNIFASTDAWTAPIQAHTGPDGAVWVVDWYNYLLSHNWHPPLGNGNAQISAIRDNQHSRIYRVKYDARPLDAILNLVSATEDQLIQTLYHPNLLWRLHAQRLLLKRGSNAGLITKLSAILNLKTVNDMGESPHVIHALRTLEGFGLYAADPATWVPVLKDLLLHPSPGVRWNALDAMPNHALATAAVLDQGRINDPDAHVRLRALHRLVSLPGTKTGAMYTPYVTLDAHSQARFTAVGGLTSSATMPATPSLYPPVALTAADRPVFARAVTASYRNGTLILRGLDADATGSLTVWNILGAQVTRVPVEAGRVATKVTALGEGTYTYRVELRGGQTATGKFSVFTALK